jgi:acetyl-CoA decarbonylase/synthase complex subunit beta
MKNKSVEKIISLLPDNVGSFENTEYPLPVKTTILGEGPISIDNVRRMLEEKKDGDVKYLCEPILLAAELAEASMPDKHEYFLTDQQVRDMVFMGSKWLAGWVLVLGGDKRLELIKKLQKQDFMVFTDKPGIEDTTFIGDRETSPVYFLQLMVRYGLIWGRIAPGDDHRMGHFLEKDMPGFIVIGDDLPPLKYHIVLGLMKLGAPAVVPSSFPFPYGNRVVADSDVDILERGNRFSNLRQRYYKDEVISLPSYCNHAYAQEQFTATLNYGGTGSSFFCVRPAAETATASRLSGDRLRITGKPGKSIGVLIEVAEKHFSDDIAATVEKTAIHAVNFISGLNAFSKKGIFSCHLREDSEFDPEKIAWAIYWEIRLQYPRIERISVEIIFDEDVLKNMSPAIKEYRKKRKQFINSRTEENTEEFCVCTECRPFSLVHTCILTPDRVPMCAARSYASVKASAYFGSSKIPHQRPSEEDIDLRRVFKKGKVLDPDRGEYEGTNRMYKEMTRGILNRVFLHSVREFPLTSCGCFQTLAFWIESAEGIGIMQRSSQAVTPDGRTWDTLANLAGGKQTPGIMGVSIGYIRSQNFLKGDGGIKNLVWIDSELYDKIANILPEGQKIATEKDVSSLKELKAFVGR